MRAETVFPGRLVRESGCVAVLCAAYLVEVARQVLPDYGL
jgi:hypothetical protein